MNQTKATEFLHLYCDKLKTKLYKTHQKYHNIDRCTDMICKCHSLTAQHICGQLKKTVRTGFISDSARSKRTPRRTTHYQRTFMATSKQVVLMTGSHAPTIIGEDAKCRLLDWFYTSGKHKVSKWQRGGKTKTCYICMLEVSPSGLLIFCGNSAFVSFFAWKTIYWIYFSKSNCLTFCWNLAFRRFGVKSDFLTFAQNKVINKNNFMICFLTTELWLSAGPITTLRDFNGVSWKNDILMFSAIGETVFCSFIMFFSGTFWPFARYGTFVLFSF